jgi:hypothetical protein
MSKRRRMWNGWLDNSKVMNSESECFVNKCHEPKRIFRINPAALCHSLHVTWRLKFTVQIMCQYLWKCHFRTQSAALQTQPRPIICGSDGSSAVRSQFQRLWRHRATVTFVLYTGPVSLQLLAEYCKCQWSRETVSNCFKRGFITWHFVQV